MLADLREGRSPVHDRHSDIEEYDIGLCLRQPGQRFLPVVGKKDLVMGLLKYAGHQCPIGLVVIHDQQCGRREVIEVDRPARLGVISNG